MTKAQKFGCLLIAEYLIAGFMFAEESTWKKALYYVGCAVKDVAVIFL